MGYFKKPIRRRTARLAADALRRQSAAVDSRGLHRKPAFLRFTIETPDDGVVGVFRASDLIDEVDDDVLPDEARDALDAAYARFNSNLPVPRALPKAAICWFREDAAELIADLRTIVECYRLAGRQVWMHATRSPGRVVYADRFQVAAIPYADHRQTTTAW